MVTGSDSKQTGAMLGTASLAAAATKLTGEDAGEDPKRFDFGFAFNNADFADRLICLRITSDHPPPSCSSSLHTSPAQLQLPSTHSRTQAATLSATPSATSATTASSIAAITASSTPTVQAARPSSSARGQAGSSEGRRGSSRERPQTLTSLSLCGQEDREPGRLGLLPRREGRHEEGPSSRHSSAVDGVGLEHILASCDDEELLEVGLGMQGGGNSGGVDERDAQLGGTGEGVLSYPDMEESPHSSHAQGTFPIDHHDPNPRAHRSPPSFSSPPPSSSTSISSSGAHVRTVQLQLCSVVLAAKSSFFRTLFTCGLKEANNTAPVVLNVTAEEEGPVIDLLRFIYTGDMDTSLDSSTSGDPDPEEIIKMYLVADKFGVSSCMRICLERLASLPMTVPTACLYLSLPDSMHAHKGVAQLLEASRSFLVAHFRELEKVYKSEEFLELPLVGVQTLLASDDVTVRDEVTAFHAMMEWLRHHYEDMEEKRCMAARLAVHVRFPLITGDDLEDTVLRAPEMDSTECQALIREAAWFRSYSLVRQLRLMGESQSQHRRFWQRRWNRHCVGHVYFDIHLERFQSLAVAATVESATFGIGGKRFYLSARHGRRDDGTETLDIHLHLENSHGVQPEIQVSFIFYAKRWPEGQFDYLRDRVTKGFGRNASNWGYSNILGRPWEEVVKDDSKYFKNGVMAVFAEVQILEQDTGRVSSVGM